MREALDRAGASGLDLDQPVEAGTEGLSAGEIRRVALARALLRVQCGGASLLLVDEPTAGLDAGTELDAVAGLRVAVGRSGRQHGGGQPPAGRAGRGGPGRHPRPAVGGGRVTADRRRRRSRSAR